ncbi:ECU10_0065 [Encephalitozoon cuniculi GB-M1]|uniref:Probable U6 snRNA-associated Sm-like protein n=3 Tax=Encephalitozoon cuniculi TaxID=6035 RepID=LSMH_ENCCU|nr:uncharacterized protein ECU10_0065 [Encephalitozoon cuniculi GB-M1]NP_586110.1 uncharacterized protein ECU07_1830 [Encephalitozoon cuniculi GB-M1]NP_586514.1 uncharacterized protein ECU11_2070 [Encephalitozoon cuniculi GB-M1]Q8SQH7.1 RecName: Full=Probable U6 snRNA-associated Sm-like protein [Encephalitozoon cuniculi GB-M1]AGE95910.1 putative U6 snRNA-associated sm-like protein [Encephalitozoon cuniculi]KMV65904.1 Sm-like protein [Encephalitozoon cuniculi EcunIII-L]UYI26420.1 Lsm ribonucle
MLDPFCFLKMYLKERVEVKTKSGEAYTGTLEGFDEHINLMLTCSSVEGSEDKVLFLRGENILFVGPRLLL